jgi:hypothetical protein
MKIYGIGLSRTGTTSLTNILAAAGYNVPHYTTEMVMYDPAIHGATDISVIPHYKDLANHFPNAKFVHTTRDRDEWVKSIVPYLERKRNIRQSQVQVQLRADIYGNPFPNTDEAYAAYDRHEADVNEFFKDCPERLLRINIVGGESPARLWEFLGVTGPDKFPHSNKLISK